MDKKVSGFGYCSCTGHVSVDIYQQEDGKYYVSIEYMKSDPFDDMGTEQIWRAVEQVESYRRELRLPVDW